MEDKKFVQELASFENDFPKWYTDIVLKAELCDYGPVKGTMVIRPYGYAIWENIQKFLDHEFKITGHQNAYFPMLIPYSYLQKEAEHVEGFAPEVALVTHAGGKELDEKLFIRPTSETIICDMYGKWIKSYRDLPVLMNQWCNVVRWEKTTRPFLRTSEFLWQEGHTVHASQEEADIETQKMLNVYVKMAKDLLAIPLMSGKKTESEKFPGAVATYTIEAMMHDGKALQSGTSHNLGQKFAKAFNIKFLDKDGVLKYGYSTSWGVTTRLIGAVIMVHGDERGLVLPPMVAPIQTVIVPIAYHKEGVIEKATLIKDNLEKLGVRVKLDDSDNSTGWKFNNWELKGVPVRIEIGPKDIEKGVAVVFRRDNYEKTEVKLEELDNYIKELLNKQQRDMFDKALKHRISRTVQSNSIEEILEAVENKKITEAYWCGCEECLKIVKDKTAATSRYIVSENVESGAKCAICGKPAKAKVLFGRAY